MAPDRSNSKPLRFGLFDSGVGGLSVLRQLQQLATLDATHTFEFVYLGDTARCPYGHREPAEIREFISQITAFLGQQNIDHLVMACNTSAAIGLNHARQVSPVPVHDLISPTAKYVAASYRKVGVMATQSTVRSGAFSKKILYHAPSCQVFEVACPLVPLVESGRLYGDDVKAALMEYTSKLEEWEVEAIVLGCTHFPFMAQAIRDLLPAHICLIDPAELLVRQIVSDLSLAISAECWAQRSPEPAFGFAANTSFYTTGSARAFVQAAAVCLDNMEGGTIPLGCVEKLPLERLLSPFGTTGDVLPSVVPVQLSQGTIDSKIVTP